MRKHEQIVHIENILTSFQNLVPDECREGGDSSNDREYSTGYLYPVYEYPASAVLDRPVIGLIVQCKSDGVDRSLSLLPRRPLWSHASTIELKCVMLAGFMTIRQLLLSDS